jgi:chromosome segregation ATPase
MSSYKGKLVQEITQLRRTLDVRRGEIALASQRVKDLEEICEAMRATSLVVSEKHRQLNDLEAELSAVVREGHLLEEELHNTEDAVKRESEMHKNDIDKQLLFLQQLHFAALEAERFAESCARREAELAPPRALGALLAISQECCDEYDDAVTRLHTASDNLEKKIETLQDLHRTCVEEIHQVAERNQQQRRELEEAWRKEEESLEKEVVAVRQRAREAAFHHRRGTGAIFDVHSDDRRDIAERRVLQQEIADIKNAIEQVERERFDSRLATFKERAEIADRKRKGK